MNLGRMPHTRAPISPVSIHRQWSRQRFKNYHRPHPVSRDMRCEGTVYNCQRGALLRTARFTAKLRGCILPQPIRESGAAVWSPQGQAQKIISQREGVSKAQRSRGKGKEGTKERERNRSRLKSGGREGAGGWWLSRGSRSAPAGLNPIAVSTVRLSTTCTARRGIRDGGFGAPPPRYLTTLLLELLILRHCNGRALCQEEFLR